MKKVLAILLALTMLTACFGTVGVFAEENGEAVIEISTAKEFVDELTANPTGNFVLKKDINFADYDGDGNIDGDLVNGARLYTTAYIIEKFSGTLDGAGHKLYNFNFDWNTVTGDVGIIQYVATEGNTIIKNIDIGTNEQKINMVMNTTAYATVGGLSAAQNSKAYKLEMTDVSMYVDISVKSTAKVNVGGFFGATQNCTLTNCELYGSVKGETTGAWINVAGFSANPKNAHGTFNHCRNYADVSAAETSSTARAAGFCGYTGFSVTLYDCINYGTIKTFEVENATNYSTNVYAGGMISNSYYAGSNILNCANFGDISSSGYAGGMIGLIGKKFGNLKTCINFGKITGADEAKLNAIFNEEGNGLESNIGNIDKSDIFADYAASDNVKFVGAQSSAVTGTEEDGKLFNVRFLSVVDGLEYTSVGYEITSYVDDDGDGTLSEWKYSHDTNNVYTKVKGTDDNGDTFEKTAEELGGNYIYALATSDVPASETAGTVIFIIKPFAKTASETLYGTSAVCIYNQGVCVSVTYAD